MLTMNGSPLVMLGQDVSAELKRSGRIAGQPEGFTAVILACELAELSLLRALFVFECL
jgi:hypothetical protein